MNVFDSWFCSFVCPFTIAIFRGGEGGKKNVTGEGRVGNEYVTGEGSLMFLIGPFHLQPSFLEYHDKKGRRISVVSESVTSLARFDRVFV